MTLSIFILFLSHAPCPYHVHREWQEYLVSEFVQTNTIPINRHPSISPMPRKDKIQMTEPVLLNPNSYASVKTVLENLCQRALNENRQWTIVGSDGIPYVLGQRLRDEHDHLKNLLLLPGPGHFEMNFVKALFKLLWPVGLQTLAKLAGYRTDKALLYCQKAPDHHKAWAMCYVYISRVWPKSCCNSI